jgi:hypothetical protein
MAVAPTITASANGTVLKSRPKPIDARKEELARTLLRKVAQGFEVESETDTQAVLVMKGHRRWFGLTNAPSVRYEVDVDETGRTSSRRL